MADDAHARTSVVVMGPSGVGKTTIAEMLSQELGWPFAEADEFHSKENVAKMASGVALTDEDRWPWLASISEWISREAGQGRCTILTCSALKRCYREVLRGADARVRFLELTATEELVMTRLPKRKGHYMPVSLLGSQFATLEPLDDDEDGVRVDVGPDPATICENAIAALGLSGAKAAKPAA